MLKGTTFSSQRAIAIAAGLVDETTPRNDARMRVAQRAIVRLVRAGLIHQRINSSKTENVYRLTQAGRTFATTNYPQAASPKHALISRRHGAAMSIFESQDPDWFDDRTVVRDLIDLFEELADLLSADAERGEFGRFAPWLTSADMLLAKLNRSVDPHVLDLYRTEAGVECVIARLRAAFMLSDVRGRA